jgi:hypothetical protein
MCDGLNLSVYGTVSDLARTCARSLLECSCTSDAHERASLWHGRARFL